MTEARERLDALNAENAWVNAIMERLYVRTAWYPDPRPEDIRAFPYEERRLLLAATGLRAEVYPIGWREDGRRIVVRSREMLTRHCHMFATLVPPAIGDEPCATLAGVDK